MKTNYVKGSYQKFGYVLLSILLFFSVGCEKASIAEVEENSLDTRIQKSEKSNFGNGFQAFHQGFNLDTQAWADQYVEGVLGWCGTIALEDRGSGDLKPSAGNGYATVMWGECNTFWSEEADEHGLPLFQYGAPATQDPSLWSSSWPASGFVQDLDIYLDPDMFESGIAFTYSQSLKMQDEMAFIYFGFDVEKMGSDLYINDFQVPEEGWYTFSFIFGDDDGNLTIDFELLDKNDLLYDFPIESRLFTSDATSSFQVDDYGSGYIWFVYIQEEVALPIDEYIIRPGK